MKKLILVLCIVMAGQAYGQTDFQKKHDQPHFAYVVGLNIINEKNTMLGELISENARIKNEGLINSYESQLDRIGCKMSEANIHAHYRNWPPFEPNQELDKYATKNLSEIAYDIIQRAETFKVFIDVTINNFNYDDAKMILTIKSDLDKDIIKRAEIWL
jgi:hypothetical protein